MPWAGEVPRLRAANPAAAAALVEEHGACVVEALLPPERAAELEALVLAVKPLLAAPCPSSC